MLGYFRLTMYQDSTLPSGSSSSSNRMEDENSQTPASRLEQEVNWWCISVCVYLRSKCV